MTGGIDLEDDQLALLLKHARAIPDDDERDAFWKWAADLLRPHVHRGIEAADVHRAINEARRRCGAAAE